MQPFRNARKKTTRNAPFAIVFASGRARQGLVSIKHAEVLRRRCDLHSGSHMKPICENEIMFRAKTNEQNAKIITQNERNNEITLEYEHITHGQEKRLAVSLRKNVTRQFELRTQIQLSLKLCVWAETRPRMSRKVLVAENAKNCNQRLSPNNTKRIGLYAIFINEKYNILELKLVLRSK